MRRPQTGPCRPCLAGRAGRRRPGDAPGGSKVDRSVGACNQPGWHQGDPAWLAGGEHRARRQGASCSQGVRGRRRRSDDRVGALPRAGRLSCGLDALVKSPTRCPSRLASRGRGRALGGDCPPTPSPPLAAGQRRGRLLQSAPRGCSRNERRPGQRRPEARAASRAARRAAQRRLPGSAPGPATQRGRAVVRPGRSRRPQREGGLSSDERRELRRLRKQLREVEASVRS